MSSIYSFEVETTKGEKISLEEYRGKVLLIVNTASKCGFTPQLDGLAQLYADYKDKGFEILAFPSNDFAGQEPLNGEAIAQFCQLNYQATYPIFNKIHVKGNDAAPLYKFLSDKKENGRVGSTPKWNFHKYLINKKGEVVDFYYTITKPESRKIRKAIDRLLAE